MKKKAPLFQSIVWILSTAVVINAIAFMAIKAHSQWKRQCVDKADLPIKAIVQTGPQKEALRTSYLAELLGLSFDRPVFASELDLKQAQQLLLASPVIKDAEVKISQSSIVYIDYTVRQPIAFLGDYKNIVIDSEGYPFPLTPFFTPKKLPEIYLGTDTEIIWNRRLEGKEMELALSLLKTLTGPIVRDLFNVQRIDVSHSFEKSYGRREIVLLTEDHVFAQIGDRECRCIYPRILRLGTKKYAQELNNYLKLREQMLAKDQKNLVIPHEGQERLHAVTKVIDMRIDQLAFIEEIGEDHHVRAHSLDSKKSL